MKYSVRVTQKFSGTGEEISKIKAVRGLNINDLHNFVDVKRFVLEKKAATLCEEDTSNIISIFGAGNFTLHPITAENSQSDFEICQIDRYGVDTPLIRLERAMEWYKNLSKNDKAYADLIIEVYANLINNQGIQVPE